MEQAVTLQTDLHATNPGAAVNCAFYPAGVIPAGDVIWVFGSDLTGKHTRGDARIAANHFNAKTGVFSGATGSAYAIPTRNARRQALPISEIQWEVKAFLSWARSHPSQRFVIGRVGNGMAGLDDRRIAPMFMGASSNCVFSEAWRPFLQPLTNKHLKQVIDPVA